MKSELANQNRGSDHGLGSQRLGCSSTYETELERCLKLNTLPQPEASLSESKGSIYSYVWAPFKYSS